ncbi:hypothetical protein C9I86_05780 [Photobacterium sp. NCIMB 13483]|uniref:phage tail-collar fiber domain-containing protein n=1 Tax=Photobacterium sp. NCIMB 13483 TaxID=2022103 RepID=UPI000D15BE88|nr:phage tail protein [Photobacterium sp. NCIMB 13483]PST93205.1 hypothetical protein C9I86_05780 [Photobacterium sp. NCIMB 13483]
MSNTATVITTKAGEALIAQMQAENKVLVIDKFIFANVPNRSTFPDRDDIVPTEHVVHESAVHEQGRLTENSMIYFTTLASNVGPFSFNWSGLFCSEHNVLVAINFLPSVDKTVDAPGITGNTLVRSFVPEYKGISETTNITVDPSSWQYDAHKRMSKMDNDTAQAIIDQNGKDWFIDNGFIVTPQSGAYSIKACAGYVSGHHVDSINNSHTTRDAIEWRPNLKVKTKDALQLFSHTDEHSVKSYYLPNSNDVPFITSATWVEDMALNRFCEGSLVTESLAILLSSFIQKGLLIDQRAETQAAFDYAADHNKKLIIDCVVWTLPINQYGRPVHIYCPPNVTVEWLAGCSINSLSTDLDHYEILTVAEENITLIRPFVIGDKETHIGTGGEWGYGVSIMSGANNVLIDNPICKDMWGDGIYIGYSYQEPDKGYPKNVTIRNPDIDNVRRNGISLCAGDNITIIDAACRNVGGAWPQAGFDCEPEAPPGYPKYLKAVVDGLRINDCISGLVQYALNQNSSDSMIIDVEFDNVVITSCEQPIVQRALGVSIAKFHNKSITINYGDGGNTSLQIGNTTDTGCYFETDKLTIKQGCRSSRPIVIMDSTDSAIFGNYKINSLVTGSDIFLSHNYPNMIGIANFEVLSNYPVKPYQWEPNAFNLDKTVKIMSEIPFNLSHCSIDTYEILPQYVAAGVTDGSSLVDLFITRPSNDTRDFVLTKRFSSVNKLYYRVGAGRQISYENVLLSSLEIKLKGTMYYIKSVGQIDYIYH